MFKYGIVSEVKPGFVRVDFQEDEIVSDWLPVVVRKTKSEKDSWSLEVNEHVVCLMDEHCNEGVCLGAIYSEQDAPGAGEGPGKFRKEFSDGTVIEYDKNAGKLSFDVKGKVDGKATVSADIEAPIINLKGNVVVTGTLQAGAISAVPGAGTSGDLNIGGKMTVTGEINATGQISSDSDVKAAGTSLKTHIHTGVTAGAGLSGPPQ